MYDETFLPYDQEPLSENELNIEPGARLSGPDRIFLRNGRLLLPKSRFEEQKRFFDRIYGKRDMH